MLSNELLCKGMKISARFSGELTMMVMGILDIRSWKDSFVVGVGKASRTLYLVVQTVLLAW
jgi:hypothetical protein